MFRMLHVVATAALISGSALPSYGGTYSSNIGPDATATMTWSGSGDFQQFSDAGMQLETVALLPNSEASASVFGTQNGGYFSGAAAEATRNTGAQAQAVSASGTSTDFAAPLASRHADLAASGDTFVLTALSSKLAATPEPASLALLGTGALTAVAMLRRRVQ